MNLLKFKRQAAELLVTIRHKNLLAQGLNNMRRIIISIIKNRKICKQEKLA